MLKSSNSSSSSSSSGEIQNRKVWIGNFDLKSTEFQILKLLEPFGKIYKFDFVYSVNARGERVPKGFAFVTYDSASEAQKAIRNLNGIKFNGRTLLVKEAHSNKSNLDPLMSRKRTLEECRKDFKSEADIEAKAAKIRALEAKLKTMQDSDSSESFKLAIPKK